MYNYEYFRSRLAEEVARVQRTNETFSVALLDVDHFKRYNDHFGHLAGNEALTKVARAMAAGIRATDCAARYGGEEFALLFPGTGYATALQACQRLQEAVTRAGLPGDHVPEGGTFTVSIGVAEYRPGDNRGEAILGRADAALYQAKAVRGRILLWSAESTGQVPS